MTDPLRFAHQFNPVIAYGDAVGNDCLELQRIFWSAGVRSDLFAAEAKPEMRALTRSWDDLELIKRRDGLLLVHHSIGTDTVPKVLASPARKAIVYHNITPGHYFAGLNDYLKSFAELGREQLKELAKAAEFGIADSEYNRKELEAAGLANTAVVPALVDWEDFDRPPDPEVARELADERTTILTVGQILPHKAVDDVGILLEKKAPEAVAAELERVVGDQALRKDLIEKGRRRVDAFSRPHVADRLKLALAQGGWELPDAKSKRIVVMSSDQRCGIHHYSLAVTDGLRERGHQVTFVGVKHLDTADLYRKLKFISSKSDAEIGRAH